MTRNGISTTSTPSPPAQSDLKQQTPPVEVHIYPLDTQFVSIAAPVTTTTTTTTTTSSSGGCCGWRHGNHSYQSIKVLHVIRHAQGTHNVLSDYRSAQHMDARLTAKGMLQCKEFAAPIVQQNETRAYSLLKTTELIVTSPLTRTIQTALHCMEPVLLQSKHKHRNAVSVIAMECIREIVNHICDRRRCISEIAREYPEVNFEHSMMETDHDALWQQYEEVYGTQEDYRGSRESLDLPSIAHRARDFFTWLSQRPESTVAIFSHGDFLRFLWNYGHASETLIEHEDIDMNQVTDTNNEPIVRYMDDSVAELLKPAFDNCELRSLIVAFV